MQGEAAEIKKAPRGILSMQLQIKKKKKEFSFLSEYAYDRSVNHIREHTSKTSHILLISNIYLEKERGNGGTVSRRFCFPPASVQHLPTLG